MFEQLDDPRPPQFDGAFRRRVVRRAHQRRRRRWAGGAGAVAASVAAGAVGLYAPAAWRARDIERVEVAGTQPVADGAPVTVLLLGRDRPRTDGAPGHGTDTILAVRIDPGRGTVSLLSLPRDLMVAGPAGTDVMINSLATDLDALVGVVETQIGIPIDHVVGIDFEGFQALVDRIGGVDVFVSAAARDTSSGLYLDQLGCVRLDGVQALALVRSRKLEVLQDDGSWLHDPYSDLSRAERQRAVVAAALAGLDRHGWSPAEVRAEVEWAVDNVTLDAGLSLDDVVRLGSAAMAAAPDGVHDITLPVVPYPADPNRLVVDPATGPAAVAAFVSGGPLPAGGDVAPSEGPAAPSVAPFQDVVAPC
jgi:LCP family protein required for cell wall assembly